MNAFSKIMLFAACLLPVFSFSQQTVLSEDRFHYAAVLQMDTCNALLTVDSAAGFHSGDTVLIIQMKGAEANTANGTGFGMVTDYKSAGLFERNVIDSIANDQIFLQYRLLHQYDVAGKVQVVSFPTFQDAVVPSVGLSGRPWDGSKGGVLAMRVLGTLLLDGDINLIGRGFRGAEGQVNPSFCNWAVPIAGYGFPLNDWRGAPKGEGIAFAPAGMLAGRGAFAGGGGGGNDHNSGGGGGAGAGAGGKGGINDEPGLLNCNGDFPGEGAHALHDLKQRLFAGGGGGAGHANNTPGGGGGAGGGVLFLDAGQIETTLNTYGIFLAGTDGGDNLGDGGGGGGGGGSAWLKVGVQTPLLYVFAHGGTGGSTQNSNQQRCFGPGGGGGGGIIYTNNNFLQASNLVLGGLSGRVTNSAAACNFSANGAENGQDGRIDSLFNLPQSTIPVGPPVIIAQPQSVSACAGEMVVFSVQTQPQQASKQWQRYSGQGWIDLPQTGDTLHLTATTDLDSARFRCLIGPSACFTVATDESLLTLADPVLAAFTSSVNQKTAVFDNNSNGANAYFWDFGDGQSSTTTDPAHTYDQPGTYTVQLTAFGVCDTAVFTEVIEIGAPPTAGFIVPDTVFGCISSAQITFENTSLFQPQTFEWLFPGGDPAASAAPEPSVKYYSEGVFSATLIAANALGADTLTQSFAVVFGDLPAVDFAFDVLANGLVDFSSQSDNAGALVWDFGDGTILTDIADPQHQYTQSGTYTVTLSAVNTCGVSVLQKVVEIVLPGTPSSNPQTQQSVALFPNPANEAVWLFSDPTPRSVQLFAPDGRLIQEQYEPDQIPMRISLTDVGSGVYWVKVLLPEAALTLPLMVRH